MLPLVPGISKKRRPAAVPPEPSLNSTLRGRDLHARLAQRNDQLPGRRVITHRLPVVPALGARAHGIHWPIFCSRMSLR